MGFKDMFRMSVTDYEFLLSQISDLIWPNERISQNGHILVDKGCRHALRTIDGKHAWNVKLNNNAWYFYNYKHTIQSYF